MCVHFGLRRVEQKNQLTASSCSGRSGGCSATAAVLVGADQECEEGLTLSPQRDIVGIIMYTDTRAVAVL